jgi:hypothetical protein
MNAIREKGTLPVCPVARAAGEVLAESGDRSAHGPDVQFDNTMSGSDSKPENCIPEISLRIFAGDLRKTMTCS